MKILHLSDIHMGSGLSQGKINPLTQLNTRLEDFIKSLRTCMDRAIEEEVDLVLFGGDAFPDSTPPPYVQEAFATQFHRLARNNIPTVLLVGNHDQHSHGQGGASLSIYRTLAVPDFIVGDTIDTHKITTPKGKHIQVTTLPWLTRSHILTRSETEGMSLAQINQLILQKLQPVLEAEIRSLDPSVPSILLAHAMVDRAVYGAEKFLAVTNRGFQIPIAFLARPEYDYVALGHVHCHQNLNPTNDPPVVYPGSIERVDFSEEKEEKGYVMIEIDENAQPRTVNWSFQVLPTRTFQTIKVDLTKSSNIHADLTKAVQSVNIQDAVVRLVYHALPEQSALINTHFLSDLLKDAHSYSIKSELVNSKNLQRLPELGVGGQLTPMDALEMYIQNQPGLQHLAKDMLEAAEMLLVDF